MKTNKFFTCLFLAVLLAPCIYAQWVTQSPLPTGHSLRSIKFISNDVGWFVGNNGVIIKTTDAGETWIIQRNNIPSALWSVSFSDANNGLVVGFDAQNYKGLILKTTNSGEDWINQNITTTRILTSVCMVDNYTGWIVGEQG